MTYTDDTPDNLAVRTLVSGGQCRVRSLGGAPILVEDGTFKIRLAVGERTDAAEAWVRVYDSGDTDEFSEVFLRTNTASLDVNEDNTIEPSAQDSWAVNGGYTYEWQIVLPVPVGEWVLQVNTAGSTQAVPMDFYGFQVVQVQDSMDLELDTDDYGDNTVTRPKLADAAGMTHQTRAALFEPGAAGSMQRCSFSFDPTNTTDLTIRFKRRGLSLNPTGIGRYWAGLQAADRPLISLANTAGVYTVRMREDSAVLLSYTWVADLEEHEWQFDFLSTGCTITLDGTVVATGVTAPTFASTAFTFAVGHGLTSATDFNGDHATYRDFEVIDPATATNKVFLRLDEPSGGPYYNAYLRVGDPLYDATNTSAVQIATTGTDTARPKSVEINTVSGNAAPVIAGGRSTHTRVAAFSGLGDHATAGQFGLVSWAPTGTPAFNVEFDCRRSLTQAGDVMVWGRAATDYANINVTAAGVVQARVNTTNICTTTVAALSPDGRTRRARVEFRDSGADVTAAIYVGRQLIVSGTLAATQFSAVAANHYVGGNSASRRYSGSIFNLLLEDLNSAANSGFWLMDEPRGSTTYANTYPGTSLAGLTINGYVSSCGVESEDGKGRPWQLGDGGAFRYGARLLADAAGITGVTSQTITGLTEDERDPTGHYAAGVFTAPCAGVATFACHASIQATTLAGADDVALTVTATSGDVYSAPVTLGAANVYAPICVNGIVSLAAAETLTAAFTSLLVGDVYTVAAGAAFQIDFTPTPVAG